MGLAVDGGHHVFDLQSSLFGRPVRFDPGDKYAMFGAINIESVFAVVGLELDPHGTAGYVAFTDDLVVHLGSGVDRHGKADTLVAAAAAGDHGV